MIHRIILGVEGAAVLWLGAILLFPKSAMAGTLVACYGTSLLGAAIGGE